jgi:phenylalanyl-tRNA synthetase beta chain
MEIRGACSAAELELSVLMKRAVLAPQHRALPPFPAVDRDLSLVVDRALPWAELSAAVKKAAGPALEAVEFLDTFHGGNVPPGKHSVHFGLRFRHSERTLTGDEVEHSVRAVIDTCSSRFAATLRA